MNARRSIVFSFLAMVLLAGPAYAGDVAGAKQFIDKTHPLQCEVISLQVRARGVDPDSPAYRALSDEFYKKAREMEQKFAADIRRYQEITQALTPQEMAEVARYAADRDEICVKTACGGSPCVPRIPAGEEAAAPKGPTKVAPQTPKIEVVPVR